MQGRSQRPAQRPSPDRLPLLTLPLSGGACFVGALN